MGPAVPRPNPAARAVTAGAEQGRLPAHAAHRRALSMSENVPMVPGVPACNGSAAPEEGLPLDDGVTNGIGRAVGTVPCMEAAAQPGTPLAKGNVEESGNSLAEDTAHGDCDGEEQCGGNVRGRLLLSIWAEKFLFDVQPYERRDVLMCTAQSS